MPIVNQETGTTIDEIADGKRAAYVIILVPAIGSKADAAPLCRLRPCLTHFRRRIAARAAIAVQHKLHLGSQGDQAAKLCYKTI